MTDPCDYELQDNGMGDVDVIETYYPVCIQQESKKETIYSQKCYPESTIAGLGVGDVIDPANIDEVIVNCGCCPPEESLPIGIDDVKGSVDVCDGGLDCLMAGADALISDSGKKVKFEMCIDGENVWKENFYVPSSKDDTVSCGTCNDIL